jgi:methionyl-tRNA synthetase
MSDEITIEDFMKVDMRTAQIVSVSEIPGADKLYKLEVDVGDLGRRTIVAGIKQHYRPEELIGKKIIYVANLRPAVVRGVRSEGMLLAADAGKDVVIAVFDRDVPLGARVR